MPSFTFIKLVGAAIRKGDAAKVAMQLTVDAMVADGITPEHFIAKGIGDDSGFRDALKASIVASFPKKVQALLNTPVAALDVEAKTWRKYHQQQIGSKVGDFKAAFNRRVKPKAAPGANKRTDDKTFLIERLAACIKRLQKSEEAPFDCEAVKASLEAALKLIK
jgi:hypothetical protein